MFGAYRDLLALLVVLIHVRPGYMLWTGVYAVFAFYALSGYLMALVLDRSYPPTREGTVRYFANRGLRIHPPYFAALVLAAVIALLDPGTAGAIGTIRAPVNALEWLRNLFIFSLHLERPETNSLISITWSVDIDLWLYVAIGLDGRRGFASLLAGGPDLHPARSTPTARVRRLALPAGSRAVLRERRLLPQLWGNPFVTGFYASLASAAYVIASLGALDRTSVPARLACLDGIAGNLSYPVFLCHLPVAAILVSVGVADEYGRTLLLWTIPAASLVGWVVHHLTQHDIEGLRDRVRGDAGDSPSGGI